MNLRYDICFCNNFMCEHKDCARHEINTPRDELSSYLTRSEFKCNEDGSCNYYFKWGNENE